MGIQALEIHSHKHTLELLRVSVIIGGENAHQQVYIKVLDNSPNPQENKNKVHHSTARGGGK